MATHTPCPIVDRCLRLVCTRTPLLTQELLSEIDYLGNLSANILSELGYTRLRGFLIIEEMLYEVGRHYRLVQTELDADVDFRLMGRSWHGLREMVKTLTHLMDSVFIYQAEYDLKATPTTPLTEDDKVRVWRLRKMMYLAGKARSGIVLFRPYLKNENVSISRLPDRLVSIYQETYGYGYHTRFLCLIRSLMDVKL